MPEYGDERVLHRTNDPPRHFRFRQIEDGMDGGDGEIQICQHVVAKIQGTIAQDVAFDPGEKTKALELFVELSDRCYLRAQLILIKPMRLDGTPAVIGDPEILQPQLLSGLSHFFKAVVPITRGRMAMEGAAQVFLLEQARDCVSLGRFKLATVFPEFRRNEFKLE